MGNKCNNCGKGILYGHNVSHSKRRTRKIFKPNLHVARIVVDGQSMKVKLCTKCLRMFKRANLRPGAQEIIETQAPQTVTA